MQQDKLTPFDTHSWSMEKVGRNWHGEPIYIAICLKCAQTVPEVRKSNKTCEETRNV